MLAPYDVVNSQFTLPFQGFPYQKDTINKLAPLDYSGFYLDQGTGKTFCSTVSALYDLINRKVDHVIILMPPILLDGWSRWLANIPEVEHLVYRGTPQQRKALKLGHGQFTLMSYQIFKMDVEYIQSRFKGTRYRVTADEGTALKNPKSKNHKTYWQMTQADNCRSNLTGTPLSSPIDAYAYCKMIAPGTYRSLRHFENVHVEARDHWGTVTKWKNLDVMARNMEINSVRLLRTDVLKDLPDVTYTPMYYKLAPSHLKLYERLVDEQLLVLENSGGKIDATNTQKLYQNLQQIVLNWGYFADNPELDAAGLDLLDSVLESMPDQKLVVCANYRMSNRILIQKLAPYGALGVYGDNSATLNRKNVDLFIARPEHRVLVLQPTSGGYGVDGLQHVCCNMLFLEEPTVPRDFHQAVARLHRNGQKSKVHVMIAVAEGTIQVRLHENLLRKDETVNKVVPNVADLRAALKGN